MEALRTALLDVLSPPPALAAVGASESSAETFGWRLAMAAESAAASGSGGARLEAGGEGRPAGRSTELDDLVNGLSPAVYRLARSVVRDPSLADDVAQETFIKVWKHLDDFRGDGSLRGWVLRIAHNTAVSTLRRIKDTATDPARLPDAHEPISTVRVVEGRLARSELEAALDELDELSREIVVLREVEGLSYDEIAEALDVPIPTVKTRLLRGRRRLASALEAWQT